MDLVIGIGYNRNQDSLTNSSSTEQQTQNLGFLLQSLEVGLRQTSLLSSMQWKLMMFQAITHIILHIFHNMTIFFPLIFHFMLTSLMGEF